MGIHWITSKTAKYYAKREKILGNGISLLVTASEKLDKLDREVMKKLGDLASSLLYHSPGYAGKLIPIIAKLFWKLADVKERRFRFVELDEVERLIEDVKKEIEKI